VRKNHRVLKASSRGRVNKGTEFQVERMHIFGRDFTVITRRRNGKAVATLQLSDPHDKVAP
jgi:hypothetical protein